MTLNEQPSLFLPDTTPATAKSGLVTRRKRGFGWFTRTFSLTIWVVLGILITILINLVAFTNVPYYVADVRSYVVGGHLALSAGLLMIVQVIANWILGLIAAGRGSQTTRRGGGFLRHRLRLVFRTMWVAVVSLLGLRLVILGVFVVGSILTFTRWLGPSLYSADVAYIRDVASAQGLPLALLILIACAQWLTAPFLRARYSAALGALGATWAAVPLEKAFMGLTFRLGAGLMASLAVLWGYGLVTLWYLTLTNPASSLSYQVPPPTWTLAPVGSRLWQAQVLAILSAMLVLLVVHIVMQAILPGLFVVIARSRLKAQALG